jgi:hypothetical protein
MKKCLFVIFVLLSSVLFSQTPGFHGVINTQIPIASNLQSEKKVFVNHSGMHLVTSSNGQITYYHVNINGSKWYNLLYWSKIS